jgi:DnaJ domain
MQKVIPGLPPHFQVYLDKLTPEGRQTTLESLAEEERRDKRRHNSLRKFTLKKYGEDIGPYDSIYDMLWREEKFRQAHAHQLSDYQLLGLTNHEGQLLKKHVRNAYRRQSRRLHPDAGGNDEAFKELHAAYRRVLASVPEK